MAPRERGVLNAGPAASRAPAPRAPREIDMDGLMQGFPPACDGQVTLANWRTSPFHRWACQHVREIVPAADIPNHPPTAGEFSCAPVDMGGLRIDRDGHGALSLDEFLQ